jgi:non-specific serine/threonine protein kinase
MPGAAKPGSFGVPHRDHDPRRVDAHPAQPQSLARTRRNATQDDAMADVSPSQPNPRYPAPLPLPPVWAPRWVGFPAAPPPLIGRDQEVAAVRDLLLHAGHRLVTVTGPGGVGKTRLALAVAETVAPAFPDGAAFVSLAALGDPALLLPAIARGLELREPPGGAWRQTLLEVLGERHLLLVLDNAEHLLAAAAEVAALVAACPALSVLVTSRTPLHLHDEQLFVTPALALPPPAAATDPATVAAYGAIALFRDRARLVQPDFALTAETAAPVVAICHRLDGLPLAIELAAAWVRVLPPPALLARLEPRLPLLRGGAADQPPRLRTMQDAIAWSYDRLSEPEQRLFRRLAVFVGGFTLEAAEWVAGGGLQEIGTRPQPATLDLLAGLIDKSLVQLAQEAGREPRFTMLETIREFALERLAESGEVELVAARHAAWCVQLAEGVRRAGGVSQKHGLATLEAEFPNLRSALSWFLERCEVTAAQHLAGELAEFWLRHGHWSEGEAWLERALAIDDVVPTTARAEALVGLNMLQWPSGRFARAEQLLRQAETIARATGDAGTLSFARLHQGYIALFAGDYDVAVARGEECLANCAAIPQGFNCHGALWLLAYATLLRGENKRATLLFERLLAAGRAGGDEMSITNAHWGLAFLAERRGELDRALAGYAEAAAVSGGFSDHWVFSHCLESIATTAVALGRPEPAVRLFAVVGTLRATIGAAPGSMWAMDRQRHEQALTLARKALGANRFAAAWDAGLAFSVDEAVAEAMALARDATQSVPGNADDGLTSLTAREQEILSLLVDGRSDREIAATLFISQRTASNHVSAILHKLRVSTRAEAAVHAVREGFAGPVA